MEFPRIEKQTKSFDELVQLFDDAFNRIIFEANHPEAHEGTYYFFNKRGKRLRPVLCMMTFEMLGGRAENAIHTAIALELFHSFTLIHDDILDDAATRRGQESVFKKFGLGNAIVTGDSVMIEAYKQLAAQEHTNISGLISQFNETSIHVLEGQQLDTDLENKVGVSEDDYLNMISYKTAALFGACLKMGGLLAGAPAQQLTYLYQTGKNLGMAFQLMDDYLDAFGSEAVFGKKIGGDILQNKNTILAVTAWSRADELMKDELLKLRRLENPEEKIHRTLEIFRITNAGDAAKDKMKEYFEKALDNLGKIDVPEENKHTLKQCFQDILQRTQ